MSSLAAQRGATGAGLDVVLAEKPSVARDIASALGATGRGDGYLHGAGYVVTWAIGHLVELPQPHDIDPGWKRWNAAQLPMLPQRWPLQVVRKTAGQFKVVAGWLRDARVRRVVCATDAGREGELIFRFIYERARCNKPVSRLWISSMTRDAIRAGFGALRAGSNYDALAAAARGRAHADWLVGLNLTRSYTLARAERSSVYSVGRVQTPTLAMLVERELSIRSFVPEDYCEVVARFGVLEGVARGASYDGVYFDPKLEHELRSKGTPDAAARARRLPASGELAEQIAARAAGAPARVEQLEAKQQRVPPPLLYDLTELQRDANRLYGYSAKTTLEIAQRLYEQRKLLTYPRSASRHLTRSVAATLPEVVRAIAAPYRELLAEGTGARPLGPRFVDDRKVGDHHAIIPTPSSAAGMALSAPEQRIYDLVCRRLLSAWHEDHLYSTTTVISAVQHTAGVDRYRSHGTRVDRPGFRVLDPRPSRDRGGEQDQALPSGLAQGVALRVLSARKVDKQTRPPPRLTDAALLTAMETAGRTLDDRELADAMKASGLGTPATRAAILETLLDRGYVVRDKKLLVPTDKGIQLIDTVHPDVKSPILTARWEAELKRIERGEAQLAAFLSDIERYVSDVVQLVAQRPPAPTDGPQGTATPESSAQARRGGTRTASKRRTRKSRIEPQPSPSGSVARGLAGAQDSRTAPSWARGPSGEWLVRAGAGLQGQRVRVRRRDGSESVVELGSPAGAAGGACLYTIGRSEPSRAATRNGSAGRPRRPKRGRSSVSKGRRRAGTLDPPHRIVDAHGLKVDVVLDGDGGLNRRRRRQ